MTLVNIATVTCSGSIEMHNHPVKSAQKIEYNLKKLARFAVDAETRDHADDAAKEREREKRRGPSRVGVRRDAAPLIWSSPS